jgi:hypothetical protein
MGLGQRFEKRYASKDQAIESRSSKGEGLPGPCEQKKPMADTSAQMIDIVGDLGGSEALTDKEILRKE